MIVLLPDALLCCLSCSLVSRAAAVKEEEEWLSDLSCYFAVCLCVCVPAGAVCVALVNGHRVGGKRETEKGREGRGREGESSQLHMRVSDLHPLSVSLPHRHFSLSSEAEHFYSVYVAFRSLFVRRFLLSSFFIAFLHSFLGPLSSRQCTLLFQPRLTSLDHS